MRGEGFYRRRGGIDALCRGRDYGSFAAQALKKMRRHCGSRTQQAGAFEKGESVEAAGCGGTKDSRDAHSASLPVLPDAGPQGW